MAIRIRVEDVMTGAPEVARDNETLLEVSERMAAAGVGALPVCGDDGILQGIVTDRDIVVRGIAAGCDPATTTVGQIETGGVVAISPDDSIELAAEIMAEQQVRRIPVVRDDVLIGIISQSDLSRALAAADFGAVVGAISRR